MPRLFITREGVAGVLGETAVGGAVAAVGIYVAERVSKPAADLLGRFMPPEWASVVLNLIVATILMYIAEGQAEGFVRNALQVAAYAVLGKALAHALGWNPGPVVAQRSYVSPWMTLERVPLR